MACIELVRADEKHRRSCLVNSRQIKELMRRPAAMAQYAATGQLPRGTRASGPLVDLLAQISPRDRVALRGITVDHRLGYSGSRSFHTAEQAFRWAAPQGAGQEVFGSFPADSWRDKRMNQRLHIEDLLACCASATAGIEDRYPALRDPAKRRSHEPEPTPEEAQEDALNPQTRSAPKIR